ncbi:hypothetical protein BAE44_0007349, partial [Dichanthelium oligosanthes]
LPGAIECKLCGLTESTNNIIFGCVVAKFVWCMCWDALNWHLISGSVDTFLESCVWSSNKNTRNSLYFLFGCVAWSLWLIIRNDVVIPSPEIGVYRSLPFMQRWKVMCNPEDLQKVEELKDPFAVPAFCVMATT